jgi:hypothetical protein
VQHLTWCRNTIYGMDLVYKIGPVSLTFIQEGVDSLTGYLMGTINPEVKQFAKPTAPFQYHVSYYAKYEPTRSFYISGFHMK